MRSTLLSDDTATEARREAWMRAIESRDPRFDGWITVGVTSTGIYCRPSCPTPVRPKRANMEFFATPASAQQAGFRACKRCAPDATPGSPEWNRRDDLVARAIRAIDDGMVDRVGVAGLAEHLAVSARHLHRLLVADVGATPLALARARRARAARVLIETTEVPFSDVAFAAGFDSIRQFNDTVREVFASSPTELRGRRSKRRVDDPSQWIALRLPLREPYDSEQVLAWLSSHAVPGIESVDGRTYSRSLRLDGGPAIAELHLAGDHVAARFRLTSLSDLQQAIHRSRRLLDLDADPGVIGEALEGDALLSPLVKERPGVRSPAEVDGCDAAIRAVVHQQVSVASARGVLNRLIADFGTKLDWPHESITHVFPAAGEWASLDPDELGLPKRRGRTLLHVAEAIAGGDVDLSPGADRAEAVSRLLALKGIGPWTASIITMRGLGDPDVFVPGDLALVRSAEALGLASDSTALAARSEQWRPWRSYVMHHLWSRYGQ